MRSTAVWLFPYPPPPPPPPPSTLTRPHPLPAFLKQVIQRLNNSCQIGEKFSVIIETKKDLSCWTFLGCVLTPTVVLLGHKNGGGKRSGEMCPSSCICAYRIAGNFRGVYISRISRNGPSLLTLKPRNLIIEWVWSI